MTKLNAPYGGSLISRIEPRKKHESVLSTLPALRASQVVHSDLLNIANGSFSPLTGFMGKAEIESVCLQMRLSSGEPWTIPIVFELTEEEKNLIGNAERIAIRAYNSEELIGIVEIKSLFAYDKEARILGTFGTTDATHPGVNLVSKAGPYALSGTVIAFAEAYENAFMNTKSPKEVREALEKMNLLSIAGFQTRNVIHRAHEYLQRVALEVCGGLLVHPVVGWKKSGDFRPEAVRGAYTKFIDAFYPKEKVRLEFLNIAMRYAGPKEAVMHAIIRKNYGCSHFIVGRDHAGVGGFYSSYAAHEIFDQIPHLGIEILRLREPFYCKKCGSVATDRTCGHAESDREFISGTKVRKILSSKSEPSSDIFRPEVLEYLRHFSLEELFFE